MSSDALALTIVVAGAVRRGDRHSHRRVPNAVTMSLAGAGMLLAASGLGRVGVMAALAGGLLGFALMLPGHFLGATGAGDVKLLSALGTLLGPVEHLVGIPHGDDCRRHPCRRRRRAPWSAARRRERDRPSSS